MSGAGTPLLTIRVERAFGPVVEGEAVVSAEGFSPRYDLDRWTGLITKPGHRLEGTSLKDKVCFFPTAKGGIAAGWAFHDIKAKGISPLAYVFGVTNPVLVLGAVLEGVCFYILQNLSLMRERNGWRNMISNSAKIVNIIGAHRFRTILRRTADCVEIACTGKLS